VTTLIAAIISGLSLLLPNFSIDIRCHSNFDKKLLTSIVAKYALEILSFFWVSKNTGQSSVIARIYYFRQHFFSFPFFAVVVLRCLNGDLDHLSSLSVLSASESSFNVLLLLVEYFE